MKKRMSFFVVLALMLACLTFGLISCGQSEDEKEGRVNPRIIVETEKMEFALDIVGSDFTMPYAGVYYENLDRVDGVEVRMSLIDPTGGYIYEDTLDYEKMRFPYTGKYQIVYKAKGCKNVTVTIYVCERLEMGTEFTLTDNTLMWEAVEGAVGYEISVNGETPTFTETASFTSDIFAQEGFYVGVTAKGDDKAWMDSYMESYENRIALQDGEVAAFNNPCYELDIAKANPDSLNAPPAEIEYLTEAECADSTGGAVRFLMTSGDYGTGLFRVNLQTTIDKDADFDGMEVRFKLDSKDYIWQENETATRLILALPSEDIRSSSRGTYVYAGQNDCWQVVKIPKSAVESFDTLDFLQFSLYNMTRAGGRGYLYLDYIRLYKDELAAPTNVAVNEDKLDWDDVEGTRQYIISVEKADGKDELLESKYYYATESEIALADLGIDSTLSEQEYEICVRAVAESTTTAASEWSEKVVKRAEITGVDVTPLDGSIFVLDVTDTTLSDTAFKHMYWKDYEEVSGAEGGYALRIATYAQSTYGKFSCFTINLTKPLNLDSEYDCVILRLQLQETNYLSLDTLGIQIVGSKKYEQNFTGTAFRKPIKVGQWMDYQLTMDDLKTYYKTGDTKISFMITNTVENTKGGTVYLKVAVDYLRYYNSVATPTNVRVEGSTLKWDAVDGASGYTVDINGNTISGITETEYDLSQLTGANTMKVLAESASAELADSVYSEEVYYEILEEDQLATFNHGGYVANVVTGNPNMTGSTLNGAIRAISFVPDLGLGGALQLRLKADYTASGGRSHVFTVNLSKGLDLTNKKAVQILFLVNDISRSYNGNYADTFRFMILNAKMQDKGYTEGTGVPYTEAIKDTTKTNFQTLTLTVDQLKELGYEDGMTYLTLSVWTNEDSNPGQGGSLYMLLGDISYCKMISVPANSRVEGNEYKWDAVDGAAGYTVSVNGTEVNVTETKLDLTAYAEEGVAALKVRALPQDTEEWVASEWTKVSYKYYVAENELATFNHAAYVNNIAWYQCVRAGNSKWRTAPTYADDGYVDFALYLSYYGDTTDDSDLIAFEVTLAQGLDLSKDGITIRMQVYETSSALKTLYKAAALLTAGGQSNWNEDGIEKSAYEVITYQQWVEIKISSAKLKELGYKDGDTKLSVGVWLSKKMSAVVAYATWIRMDYIEYYTDEQAQA